jgi:DNA-binding MarR family transcriptional regulator
MSDRKLAREIRAASSGATTTKGKATREDGLDLFALKQTPGFLIRVLQIQIFEGFFDSFDAIGLSPAEHSSLITIRDNPAVTQSELASILRIQLPNLVKILGKLEEQGVLKRTRSQKDKRSVELALTADGERLTAKSSEIARQFNDDCLAPLNLREKAQFISMLQRLTSIDNR